MPRLEGTARNGRGAEDEEIDLAISSDIRASLAGRGGYPPERGKGSGLQDGARLGLSEDEVAEKVWLAEKWTVCEELTPDGESGVILVVQHAG
jgi:hypothetical protein